jgi:hypothetical protein
VIAASSDVYTDDAIRAAAGVLPPGESVLAGIILVHL